MKLQTVNVANYLMIKHLSFDMTQHPVCLIAGDNEQGKSSLLEAIRHAITGESTRVRLKKDLVHLVRDGAKTGQVTLSTTSGNAALDLPSGKTTPPALDDLQRVILPYLLDPARFASLKEDERRVLLMQICNTQYDHKHIIDQLKKRNCDPVKIETIAPLLRSGFDAAEAEAKTQATELKARWKTITGETWGKDKGEKWEPPPVETDAAKSLRVAENAKVKIAELDQQIAEAQQQFGAVRAALAQQQAQHAKRAELTEKAGKIERLKAKLAHDSAELSTWEKKVAEARWLAGETPIDTGAPAHYLLRGLASVTAEFLQITSPTPENTSLLNRASVHLEEYRKQHGEPVETGGDPSAVDKLKEYERSLQLMQRCVDNDKRDLAEAEAAASVLESLNDDSETLDLATLESDLKALIQKRDEWQADEKKYRALATQAETYEQNNRAARECHGDIVEWLEIASALAPDGIPGEIITDAMRPLNDRLRNSASATGWGQVSIDADMQIRVDGRIYSLQSESAKWRTDAMLAEAFSALSGLKLIALDRIDVLSLRHRLTCLQWIYTLAQQNEIDSALVFGTFKNLPSVPPSFLPLWIEQGAIAQHEKAA